VNARARTALLAALLVTALAAPRPAVADDALTVIGGAPGNFYEVIDYVAQRAGFFKAEHLDVDKQYGGNAATAAQLVATGKADILSSSIEPLIQGYEKGVRLQVFLSRDPRYDYVLGVLDDSPIRTLADFKGVELGETNVGATAEVSANDMLRGAGLTRADYTFVPIGIGAQGLAAIVSKKVGGVVFPSVELGLDSVVGHVTFRIFRDPLLDSVPNVGFIASPATIAAKGPQIARYARALVKASLFIHDNPRAAARYFLEGTGQQVTPEAIDTMTREIALLQGDLPAADPANKRIGYFDLKGVALYCRFMNDAGLTKQLVPAAAVATNQFIAFANDFDHRAVEALAKRAR
jgi:NitT/TauT family transport system substrate-binding protein